MTWAERLAVAPLLAGIIFIGVYPQPLLTRIQPAVDHLVAHVEYADPSLRIPSQGVGHGTFAVPPDQVVDLPVGGQKTSAAGASK
jgi:NADH-quinone oxidoreductase subunit M